MTYFLINKFSNPKVVKTTLYMLSNTCNNNCKYCFFDNSKFLYRHHINYDTIINKIKLDTIYLSGGEPLFSSEIVSSFKKIINNITYKIDKLVMFTNGYSINILNDLNVFDKFRIIHIIVNSDRIIEYHKYSNVICWNKIYLNDEDSINKLLNYKNTNSLNVVFSLQMDSIWKKHEFFTANNLLLNKLDLISSMEFNRTRIIDISTIKDRLNGFYSLNDFYDFGFYHPYIKSYSYDIRQISCSKCNSKSVDDCFKKIKNDECIRLPKMCYECEYKDICFAPVSKFNVMNYDVEFCNNNLKPLYKWYIDNFLETEI